MTDKRMSFLPEDYVEQRVEQRTNLICLTLFVVVLAGVIAAYVVTSRQRSEVRQQRQQINEAYAEAARRIEQLEELRRQKERMLRKAEITSTLLEPVPRTVLLADLINRMPASMTLFDVQLSSKQVRTAAPIQRGRSALANRAAQQRDEQAKAEAPAVPKVEVSLVLVGVAPTDVQVAQYMAALSQSELLDDVNLVFSEETRVHDTVLRKFRIDMALAADADVRRMDPLTKPRRLKDNPMQQRSTITEDITAAAGDGSSGSVLGAVFQKLAGGGQRAED